MQCNCCKRWRHWNADQTTVIWRWSKKKFELLFNDEVARGVRILLYRYSDEISNFFRFVLRGFALNWFYVASSRRALCLFIGNYTSYFNMWWFISWHMGLKYHFHVKKPVWQGPLPWRSWAIGRGPSETKYLKDGLTLSNYASVTIDEKSRRRSTNILAQNPISWFKSKVSTILFLSILRITYTYFYLMISTK